MTTVHFDEILTNHLGDLGKFQILLVIVMSVEEFLLGYHIMAPVFTAATPRFRCQPPTVPELENCTRETILQLTVPEGKMGECLYYTNHQHWPSDICRHGNTSYVMENVTLSECESWEYDMSVYGETLVTEWDLVCSNAYKTRAVASAFLAGTAVGTFFSGWLSDKFGRKKVLVISGFLNVVVGLASVYLPSYYAYVAMRFFHGLLSASKMAVGFLIGMEFTGPSRRVYVGVYYMVCWAVGFTSVGGMAYLVRHWRTIMLVVSCVEAVYYVLVCFTVPESPRWLYAVNRKKEASAILRKVAKFNNVSLPENLQVKQQEEMEHVTPLHLFRLPQIRMASLILIFVWAANGMTYYGLSLNTSALAGNPYVNFLLCGVVEIPAYVFILVVLVYFGRVKPFVFSMLVAGICVLIISVVPAGHVVTGLAITGKFFITATFTMAYIYTSEVYPTCIRSIGMSTCNLASKTTAPIAPYITMLDVFHPAISTVVFGLVAIVGGVLFAFMPETRGNKLVQSIEDGEKFIEANKLQTKCLPCGVRPQPDDQETKEDLSLTAETKDSVC